MKIGERIGAILGSKKNGSVDFLGYGIYEGDEIPVNAVGQMAEMIREVGNLNPKLKLWDGSIVYGCECWWGPEEKVKTMLKDQVVNLVSITKVREEYNKKHGN